MTGTMTFRSKFAQAVRIQQHLVHYYHCFDVAKRAMFHSINALFMK